MSSEMNGHALKSVRTYRRGGGGISKCSRAILGTFEHFLAWCTICLTRTINYQTESDGTPTSRALGRADPNHYFCSYFYTITQWEERLLFRSQKYCEPEITHAYLSGRISIYSWWAVVSRRRLLITLPCQYGFSG